MYSIILSNQFKKDLKLLKKRGYNLKYLNEVVDLLALGNKLPTKNRDHSLSGEFVGFRECHIQSDWLLVYRIDGND